MKNLLNTEKMTLQINTQLICSHLNLDIHSGEMWGVLGINGSGKTTLLHTLAGLQPVTSGKIFLQHKLISTLSRKTIAQQIGILLQSRVHSFTQSVFEHCLTGRYPHLSSSGWESIQDKQITQDALQTMELANKSHCHTHTLSGGEYQRLSLATVMTQMPSLYLLDEPTNHLDLYHQIKVLNHFKQLTQTTPTGVVMALHDINLAQHYCTHILMLFPQGETLHGPTAAMLTAENLEQLYHHPICSVTHQAKHYWLPEFYCKSI